MPIKKTPPTLPYFDTVSYELSRQRRINFFGEVGSSVHAHIENSLAYMTGIDKKSPVHIYMNSPGGSVIDGLAIYDSIRAFAKIVPIHIHVVGACMSMAVEVLQAGTVRTATPNSQFLMHEVSYGNRGSLTSHDDSMEAAAKLQKRLDEIIIERSSIPLDKLKALTKRRDYGFTAQEALQHNLIDSISE